MKLDTTTKTLKVREFNELLSCHLCKGYLINPTTVDICLHTYCRSCIVQHLLRETCCPQCKIDGGGKQVTETNLKSDDVLRALVFKLVPGLYQKERERATQFKATLRNGQQKADGEEAGCTVGCEQDSVEENFFAPTEPISLSLEYHPALLKGCSTSQIPPVRYLQCPAGLKIRHLKRFLCSKFDIDPESKRIEVEVIYEDEVLPNDFTLMDVGYCYDWKRNAPMKFTYRILFYGDELPKLENEVNKSEIEIIRNDRVDTIKATDPQQNKDVTICDETSIRTLSSTSSPPSLNFRAHSTLQKTAKSKSKSSKSIKPAFNKTSSKVATEEVNAPVKMIIARKSSADCGKKPSPKRNGSEEVTYTVTNDFKSLRSNDMRYSDYAVSSTTNNSNSPKSSPKSAQRSPKALDVGIVAESPTSPVATVVPKCNIVVSIPQSQMPKSPYSVDDEFENVSLAQLKTASKKSPPSTTTTTVVPEPLKSVSTRNVPKLKIELNSLKTRLSISKPKSAGVLQGAGASEKRERVKQRKHSLDDVAAPLNDRLDLETYAKNIGLQPIEVLTPPESAESCDKLKYSPNASPLSSASSTTSSSNNAFPLTASTELATTSFHKKRKKKHSKDSKDSKDSKRRRMHAEISSKPEEESPGLKMKVKLTTPHNHRSHKSDSSGTKKNSDELRKSQAEVKDANVLLATGSSNANDSLLALNKILGEESRSINHLMMEKEKSKEIVKVVKADETLLSLPQSNLIPKPVNNIKDVKLPASPPLPPSLFKTTPLNFNTLTVTSTTAGKSTISASKHSEVVKQKQSLLPGTKPSSVPQYSRQSSLNAIGPKTHPHFIVPSLPRRSSPASNSSYTPSSIASASSKQFGMHLKRSASLDEFYTLGGRGKQPKLDASQRKSLYSSYANKPFTPPSTVSITKIADTVSHVQSSSGSDSAVTITARVPGGATQAQSRCQLPPYTQLHLPFNKPAVEIVRISSSQGTTDVQMNSQKSGRVMGPPLSMVKGKKAIGQQMGHLASSGVVKSSSTALNATSLGHGRNNPYRVSPPALVNLHGTTFSAAKRVGSKAAEMVCNKQESNGITNGATEKQLHQQRISLRDFRPTSRDHNIDMVDVIGGVSGKDEFRLTDTTGSAPATVPSARESLEAALNKIKQNITSTTVQDSASASASKQHQLTTSTDMSSEDLQNLHLLSESATAREKITIRASQSYEKPKAQQSSLVRQQNASVRNIPNPSALAFRNMSTLPAVSSTAVAVSLTDTNPTNTTTCSSSTSTTSSTSPPTQKKLPLVTLPLTNVSAPLSPSLLIHSITTTSGTATATATSITTTATRTIKKPTTIDQVAANLNMRASAAAAEAYAAKLSAAEDAAQITSSTCTSTTIQSNMNDKKNTTSATNMASSTTANMPSPAEGATEQVKKMVKVSGEDESVKAKVLPKSIADSDVTTAIITDVASIKNARNNNNNNNNSNNKNNNTSNSNVKYGVTAASAASD
ncbi:protein suppressor 2 of zeste [Anastrepha obliqua]|uniref:protein suppressor 2 of zeste n=1 Tax=Anastrepha obliqua TaxID=95512 RepID=UPI002409261E|nr:protein suppressor 2 of zeste [Anastrepha obliqua]